MNARSYRVNLNVSPLDFPAIIGLGESSIFFQTETPKIINNKVVLTITNKYILLNMSNNKEHQVLSVESIYEIPTKEIKHREDVYEFYKDATLGLNEAFQYACTQLPTLSKISFPALPIETYKREIDRVFNLLNSQN